MPTTPTKDYYAILRVRPEATAAEIKAAFRRLSFETHPDHNASADANRKMAELIEARNVLLDPEQRRRFDRERAQGRPKPPTVMGQRRREEARKPPTRPVFRKPATEGMGSIQPERMPDWYEFLGLRVTASSAEVITALRRMTMHLNAANYSPADDQVLRRQVRMAADALTTPKEREIYDRAMQGIPPPPGRYPHLHPNLYTFLGVSPNAPWERIALKVTDLSAGLRNGSPELAEIQRALKVLRDPVSRAEYDAALAGAG
ncbi:MAG: J domain-containing protein [Hyphomicrobiales bacterium]